MASLYRMTDEDIRVMVHLRAANAAIFTGRRNSAMRGWRAIRNEMGLQGVLAARQLKKKWHNMKDKYKYLKNPPEGLENLTKLSSWPWFPLMDDAMSGRLVGTAKLIQPSPLEDDDDDEEKMEDKEPQLQLRPFQPPPGFAKLCYDETAPIESDGPLGEVMELNGFQVSVVPADPVAEVVVTTDDNVKVPELPSTLLYATLVPDCGASESRRGGGSGGGHSPQLHRKLQEEQQVLDRRAAALERDRDALERDREALERDREALERDRDALEREREALDQERMAVERDRAGVERERAAAHRDFAGVERDRAAVERDRACLDRDRAFLDRDRARLDRDRVLVERELDSRRECGDGKPADGELVLQTRFYRSFFAPDLDPAQLESRHRLVALFQKAVEKL